MCSIKITLTGFRVRCFVQWWKQSTLNSNHIIKASKVNTTNRLMPGHKANLYSLFILVEIVITRVLFPGY